MAAVLMSVSESLQISLILDQQLKQQQQQSTQQQELPGQLGKKQLQEERQRRQGSHDKGGVSLCQQLLLVAILFSIEFIVALEQIYTVPIIQYLEVPLSLVSLNGVIAGLGSMAVLPLVGYISDRGTNTRIRKMCTVLAAMFAFIIGLILLGLCGVLKILQYSDAPTPQEPLNNINVTNTTLEMALYNSTSAETSNDTTIFPHWYSTTQSTTSLVTEDEDSLPATAFMSILSFAIIDIGFDTSTSLTRAFVLETVPSFQHSSILVTATLIQAIAGITLSIIGCFDLQEILGSLFHTDGTAAMIVFLSFILTMSVIICTPTTTITAYVLGKTSKRNQNTLSVTSNHVTGQSEESAQRAKKRGVTKSGLPKQQGDEKRLLKARSSKYIESDKKPYVADILHTEEGDTSTRPLLLEDSLKGMNYAALSGNGAFSEVTHPPVISECKLATFRISSSTEESLSTHHSKAEVNRAPALPLGSHVAIHKGDDIDPVLDDSEGIPEVHPVCNASLSPSVSAATLTVTMSENALGPFHTRKLSQIDKTTKSKGAETIREHNRVFKNRFVLLSLSTFFAFGALITCILYTSNALTVGIFQGEPAAPDGSPGRHRYDKGLQTSARGSVALYSGHIVASLVNNKIMDRVGEKVQFVVCFILYAIVNLVFVLTKRVEVYFVYMVCCGIVRSVIFSIPFIMAQTFSQERIEAVNEIARRTGSTAPISSAQIGKVMTSVGFLLPLHYTGLSLFMGPLMDATANVWAPIYYSQACAILASAAFLPIFFIRN